MEQLKPCPFCGHEVGGYTKDIWDGAAKVYIIECINLECFMRSDWFNNDVRFIFCNKEEAIKQWNTRHESNK